MGYGEWVGNQSVHWTIVHEDETGTPVRLSPKDGRGHHPKTGTTCTWSRPAGAAIPWR
jgi:hypothetical protein